MMLLAEDNENDILLAQTALKEAGIVEPVQVVRDGAEAIAYLNGDGRYANRAEYPLPSILFLDLKMPRKTGFEVLQWIRNEPALCDLKVITLTGSANAGDHQRAYESGANLSLLKPAGFSHFVTLFKTLHLIC